MACKARTATEVELGGPAIPDKSATEGKLARQATKADPRHARTDSIAIRTQIQDE
jgi:hypothetical protein